MTNLAACKSRINSTVVILALLQYQSSTGYDSIDSKDTVFYFDKGNCNNWKEKEMRRRQAASRYPLIIFLKNRTIIIIVFGRKLYYFESKDVASSCDSSRVVMIQCSRRYDKVVASPIPFLHRLKDSDTYVRQANKKAKR